MSDNQTLFDKAVTNFNTANILRRYVDADESQLNIIGYHLQQSMEFAIKFMLENNGVIYPKTHDIGQLLQLAEENNVDLKIKKRLSNKADMLTLWEQKSRYILGYKINLEKIDDVLPKIDEYLKSLSDKQHS